MQNAEKKAGDKYIREPQGLYGDNVRLKIRHQIYNRQSAIVNTPAIVDFRLTSDEWMHRCFGVGNPGFKRRVNTRDQIH